MYVIIVVRKFARHSLRHVFTGKYNGRRQRNPSAFRFRPRYSGTFSRSYCEFDVPFWGKSALAGSRTHVSGSVRRDREKHSQQRCVRIRNDGFGSVCLVELVIPKRTNKFPWQLFTERVPFSDVLASALPLEIAIRGLEPEWPGSDAEARGLTSGVWKMMKECWKREPSSRTILGSDLWETSPISLTGLRVILGDARTFARIFRIDNSCRGPWLLKKVLRRPKVPDACRTFGTSSCNGETLLSVILLAVLVIRPIAPTSLQGL